MSALERKLAVIAWMAGANLALAVVIFGLLAKLSGDIATVAARLH